MANKERGYVYIFTNKSFREGWVKIGKTTDIKKRLTQLDNTSCPLPFDVYATLKTRRYDEAEDFVHEFISHFNQSLRIRPNREYFNVAPEEALDILYQVKKLMNEPDSEITVYDEKGKKCIKQLEKKHGKTDNPQSEETIETPDNTTETGKHAWLICYDSKNFKVEDCFRKNGQVYWMHKGPVLNVQKGDIAFLYASRPESAIRFKVEVVESQMPYSHEMDAEKEFFGTDYMYTNDKKFFLVRLIGETHSPALKHDVMMKGKLMGKRPSATKLSKEEFKPLKEYIEEHFEDVPPAVMPSFPTSKNKTQAEGHRDPRLNIPKTPAKIRQPA